MKTKVVCLESPYAGDVENNLKYARRAMRDSIERGEAPLASHLLYTQVLSDDNPIERTAGINLGYAWMDYADAVVVYKDYGISEGMMLAIERARSLDIEIVYRQIGRNQ
jgi:hypothetical protein